MQENYCYLTPKQKRNYWEAVEKMEAFIANLEFPNEIESIEMGENGRLNK